jgi:hypothetical protein
MSNSVFKIKLFNNKEKALNFQKEVDGELFDYNIPKDRMYYEAELKISEGSFDPDVPKIFPYCVSWME